MQGADLVQQDKLWEVLFLETGAGKQIGLEPLRTWLPFYWLAYAFALQPKFYEARVPDTQEKVFLFTFMKQIQKLMWLYSLYMPAHDTGYVTAALSPCLSHLPQHPHNQKIYDRHKQS